MKKLPLGIEDFREIMSQGYYYIDKTSLIQDVLKEKVCLYTRPRRFGKTLNMSMLYYFFSNKEKDTDDLFSNLEISKNQEIMKMKNQYPVIFLSFKDMKMGTFDHQIEWFQLLIGELASKFPELYASSALDEVDKELFLKYRKKTASFGEIQNSLHQMSIFLRNHYQKNVVILIDEYDVPLQSAYLNGYYEEMVSFLRNVFSSVLKTNSTLERAVLTGCLRIAKESIFTGLNNFSVRSILDESSSVCFGFTQEEMNQILHDYDIVQYKEVMQKWYDGYRFGRADIYNPWSVLKYADQLVHTSDTYAQSYWANTSSNDIIYRYISHGNLQMKRDFDQLISGQTICKKIKPELTYREMDDMNNVYSFLLFSGYLKIKKRLDRNEYELMIPNYEIKTIYEDIFQEWATEIQDSNRSKLINALLNMDVEQANEILNYILLQSMSYYDSQEGFYHGFMMGLLSNENMYSNIESGDGRSDIKYLPVNKEKRGFVLELKVCREKDLYDTAVVACEQIREQRYLESDFARGYQDMIGYGIAFEKKRCFIKLFLPER